MGSVTNLDQSTIRRLTQDKRLPKRRLSMPVLTGVQRQLASSRAGDVQMSEDDMQGIDEARARVAVLRGRLEAQSGGPVRLLETHISWVLLTADDAYKLKKPLRLPFLDCSSLEVRRWCCEEELRLNRRLAASIYRGVVEVRQGAEGPDFGGTGPVVDFAVWMRRFADGSLWSERVAAGTLGAQQTDAMARRLAAFHREADALPPSSRFGSAEVQQRITLGLLEAQQAHLADQASDWPRLRGWLLDEMARLGGFWEQRRQTGRVRECHGDLHLANLVQEEGEQPTAFDAIEFDAELRCIDVFDDIAFTVMDLLANGCTALAWRFLDVYLESSGDFAGLPGLRFYLVRRAVVRALVRDLSAAAGPRPAGGCDAGHYRALAAALATPAEPWLLITHGLPASGKSRVAAELVARTGAIRLRSDVERKRLAGLAPLDSSLRIGDIYTEAANQRTYQRLHALAEGALRAGWPVVVDAAFLRRRERHDFAMLAGSLGLRFAIVDCRAPLEMLHERIRRRIERADDPSEADPSVLERLSAVAEPLDPVEAAGSLVVDGTESHPAQAAIDRWMAETGADPEPSSAV